MSDLLFEVRLWDQAVGERMARFLHPIVEWIAGRLADAWDWIIDCWSFVALICAIMLGAATLVSVLSQQSQRYRQQQIDLCIRAFDYTHEQCEFIVRNHVMPR